MTPPDQSFPPETINACKGMSTENFKTAVNDQALILKTTYWYAIFPFSSLI